MIPASALFLPRASAMVKFYTQSCPICPLYSCGHNPLPNSKCLCVVKGHMVPARNYVTKGTEGKEGSEKEPVAGNPGKTNEERFFTEIAKKYLEELKMQEEKLKKKPKDGDEK